MARQTGAAHITYLRKSWTGLALVQLLAGSFALALLFSAVTHYFLNWPFWMFVPLALLVFLLWSLKKPFWKINNDTVSRYLNAGFPELEESAGLVLKPEHELNGLQRLQREKVIEQLAVIPTPTDPLKRSGLALLFLIIAVGISTLTSGLVRRHTSAVSNENATVHTSKPVKDRIPAEIERFTLKITPPAYTGLSVRNQQQFTLKAEVGALLSWEIHTNIAVKKLSLVFNDKDRMELKSEGAAGKVWKLNRPILQSGFYQVIIEDKKSDLYQMEVIPDLPVSIRITHPKQHTTIDYGQPQKVNLNVSLTDDYGIKDAFIAATMASGKGEGVRFTEKKIPFNTGFNQQKTMTLDKLLDLKALGMKPGDELYFFVRAADNHGQLSSSDIYFVSIVDTVELMSMAGMTNGVNLVPEYFRSQRQIIMDTEKLLAEKGNLTEDQFKERSNTLGVDQRLLRLRYGKFLGEETENEIGAGHGHEDHGDHEGHEHEGEEHEHEHAHAKKGLEEAPPKFGNVQAIMEQYAHNHDTAEDAGFFEPEQKAQLKAVLTEMWNSELRLRTYKPLEALPFEYKALRLLKDLQQKSRAYVAKTTVKVSQLKPEKRLTGELDKIGQPLQHNTFEQKDQREETLSKALMVLEDSKNGKNWNVSEHGQVQAAERYIILAATDQPQTFLPALKSLRNVLQAVTPGRKDLEQVQKAIRKMMVKIEATPELRQDLPASGLYDQYFNHLKKAGR